MKILYILPVLFLALIWSCEDVEDPDSPSAPRFVVQSASWDSIHTGIGPVDDQDAISLQWHRNPESDLAGYIVYRAADTTLVEDHFYEAIDSIYIHHANPTLLDTEYIDTQVELAMGYRYYLRAFDDARNLSKSSDTTEYILAVKPSIQYPKLDDKDVSAQPEFSWKYTASFQYAIDYFYIEVENVTDNHLVWFFGTSRNNYDGKVQLVKFNADNSALEDSLSPEKIYRWQVKAVGRMSNDGVEREGALSNWYEFTVEE